MIVLSEDKAKVEEYNKRMKELADRHKDTSDFFKPINSLDEVFIPYKKYLDSLSVVDKEKYKIIPDTASTLEGIYLVWDCNDHYLIDEVTTSNEQDHLYNYGVADNATQILENCAIPDNAVVLLMPVFKDGQPSMGGWRWHKWGKYYGVQEHLCEYIADEPNVEMVFCFDIVTIEST